MADRGLDSSKWRTTASAMRTVSRKCAITIGVTSRELGDATQDDLADPGSPTRATRSERQGEIEPSTARITATETRPVMVRFVNSIIACFSNGATSRPLSQFGQSGQPSPEPVSRTAAPLTTIAASDRSAPRVKRRYSFGVMEGRRTVGS
jgi:hypothetical protein